MKYTEPMRRPSPLEEMHRHLQNAGFLSTVASIGTFVHIAWNYRDGALILSVVVTLWMLLILSNHDRLHMASTFASFPLVGFWCYESDNLSLFALGILVANLVVRFIETVVVTYLRHQARSGRFSDDPHLEHPHGVLYTFGYMNAGLLILSILHKYAEDIPEWFRTLDIPTPVLAFSTTLLISGVVFLVVLRHADTDA